MQPVTPSLWRRAGQVLLSFFAFALIICAFPPFVNPPERISPSPGGRGLQPVTPSLWRRAGQVLLSFFAFALIICAFPPFVNPPGCAWMQFAVSLVPRSHCEVAIPCSPRGSSSAPAAGRRTACPPQVRALRLLPPHWGWRPRSPRFIVFPEKGRTLPLPPANGEPRPARVDLPPRALRLLPPHWGWRPRSPRFIVFPEKGRTLPLPPANGEPRPARVDLPPPLPQAVGRIAHRRCGVPTAGADCPVRARTPQVQKSGLAFCKATFFVFF